MISNSAKKKHFINEVERMTQRCRRLNDLVNTKHYKYDKETQLWHGYITNCKNELIRDFGYDKSFDKLEEIMKGEF